MGSHSVTCHPTEVNLPTLLPGIHQYSGAMELVLTCFDAIKVAFAFEFEWICKLKFAFVKCEFWPASSHPYLSHFIWPHLTELDRWDEWCERSFRPNYIKLHLSWSDTIGLDTIFGYFGATFAVFSYFQCKIWRDILARRWMQTE